MPYRHIDLNDLNVAREVRIETHAQTGEGVHSTIVWVVVDQDEVFVRSVRGEQGRWFREAIGTLHVTIDDQGRRLEAIPVLVTDEETIRRVDAALTRKYANDEGYASMMTAGAEAATLRLDPRTPDEIPLEAPAYLGDDEPSELHGHPVEVGMLDGGPAIEQDVLLQPHKPA